MYINCRGHETWMFTKKTDFKILCETNKTNPGILFKFIIEILNSKQKNIIITLFKKKYEYY